MRGPENARQRNRTAPLLSTLLYFYRIRRWENKDGWARLIGYAILGYGINMGILASGFSAENVVGVLLNLLIIGGIFMYAYSINDFYDCVIEGDRNFLSEMIRRGEMNRRRAKVYCHLPLLALLGLPLINFGSAILALFFLAISVLHSVPPMRTKDRFRGFGFLLPPLAFPIIFLQSHLILSLPNTRSLMLAFIIGLNVVRGETIGTLRGGRRKILKKYGRESMVCIIKVCIFSSSALSALFAVTESYIFLVTTFLSIVRYVGLEKLLTYGKISDRLPFPEGIYEYALYIVLWNLS